jgi:hypothetical protein
MDLLAFRDSCGVSSELRRLPNKRLQPSALRLWAAAVETRTLAGLIEPVLGRDRTDRIIRTVNELETLSNVRELVRLMTA